MWSLLAGVGRAWPSHHAHLSRPRGLCKWSARTRRAGKGSEEAVRAKQENTGRTPRPRKPLSQKRNRTARASESKRADADVRFPTCKLCKGREGPGSSLFSAGKPVFASCCTCLVCTINQHLGIKCGNLYSLQGICGLYVQVLLVLKPQKIKCSPKNFQMCFILMGSLCSKLKSRVNGTVKFKLL